MTTPKPEGDHPEASAEYDPNSPRHIVTRADSIVANHPEMDRGLAQQTRVYQVVGMIAQNADNLATIDTFINAAGQGSGVDVVDIQRTVRTVAGLMTFIVPEQYNFLVHARLAVLESLAEKGEEQIPDSVFDTELETWFGLEEGKGASHLRALAQVMYPTERDVS